jgi:hypothetical protein
VTQTRKAAAPKSRGKAARAEVNGSKSISFEELGLDGKGELKLPPELPLEFLEHMEQERLVSALRAVIGDQIEVLYKKGLSVNRGFELASRIVGAYDLTLGESIASPES